MWAAQYLYHTKSRSFLTSGGLGTMGFGYGAAIGAQVALGKDHRVVMLTGDGSFHMNLNEGCTAVSYELPIITVIFDNQVRAGAPVADQLLRQALFQHRSPAPHRLCKAG